MQKTTPEVVRLDKWLWAARFYRTRALAVDAINGGHVHVNGLRVKPSRSVNLGDELRISKGVTVFSLVVRDISAKRGPATQARGLYVETEQSIRLREQLAAERKLVAASSGPKKRPDKRARRRIIRFINKNKQAS
ncbi:Ribosome-associated heat shock protein implicated in the recycling of the 50S subunit (S4 paralog) [hydrothermal vent metagenome]|uniref:Ribosome-associated heat shock protein implicated in the recycling of the 50S subunit (S4 paralog) n=1 Tax=hydrothermal vent metagenome TaxID=652676 RepID=A0A3B1BA37_9ZZZZ